MFFAVKDSKSLKIKDDEILQLKLKLSEKEEEILRLKRAGQEFEKFNYNLNSKISKLYSLLSELKNLIINLNKLFEKSLFSIYNKKLIDKINLKFEEMEKLDVQKYI